MISDDLEGMENVILKIGASVGTDVNKVSHRMFGDRRREGG